MHISPTGGAQIFATPRVQHIALARYADDDERLGIAFAGDIAIREHLHDHRISATRIRTFVGRCGIILTHMLREIGGFGTRVLGRAHHACLLSVYGLCTQNTAHITHTNNHHCYMWETVSSPPHHPPTRGRTCTLLKYLYVCVYYRRLFTGSANPVAERAWSTLDVYEIKPEFRARAHPNALCVDCINFYNFHPPSASRALYIIMG